MKNFIILPLFLINFFSVSQTIEQAEELRKNGSRNVDIGNLDSANYYLDRAKAIFKQEEIWEDYYEVILTQAEIHARMGNEQKYIDIAKSVIDEIGDRDIPIAKADAYYCLANGISLLYAENDSAIVLLDKALGILDEKNINNNLKGKIYNIKGIIFNDLGDYENSKNSYEEALKVFRQLEPKSEINIAKMLGNIGNSFYQMGLIKEGIAKHRESYEMKKTMFPKIHPAISISLNNIGNGYVHDGQMSRAIEYFKASLDIREKYYKRPHFRTSGSLHNIGGAYFQLGNIDEGLYYLRRGVHMRKLIFPPGHPFLMESYLDISRVLRAIDIDSSDYYLQQAQEIFDNKFNIKNDQWANLKISKALNLIHREEYTQSIKAAEMALEVLLDGYKENTQKIGEAYQAIGDAHACRHDWHKAVQSYHAGVQLLHNSFSDSSIYAIPMGFDVTERDLFLSILANKCHALYQLNKQSNQPPQLEKLLLLEKWLSYADSFLTYYRNSVFNLPDIVVLSEQSQTIYGLSIEVYYTLYQITGNEKYIESAFGASEKSRSNLLLRSFSESEAKLNGVPDSLLYQERFFKRQISKMESYRNNSELKDQFDQTKLYELQRRYESLIEDFEKKFPEYYKLKHQYSFKTLTEVNANPETLFIEYFKTDTSLFRFSRLNNRSDFERTDFNDSIKQKLTDFRALISQYNDHVEVGDYENKAYQLHQHLLGDVLDRSGNKVKKITVVAHDVLEYLPFELLAKTDNNALNFKEVDFLLNNHSFSYAYSASLTSLGGNFKYNTDKKFIGIASSYESYDPEGLQDLSAQVRNSIVPLKWNAKEVENIGEIVDGEVYTANSATERAFKDNVSKYDFVHLALHALVDDDNPMNSKLVFTNNNDSTEDGLLHAFEIYNMNMNAHMAVLSACNTAYGKLEKGEGVMSLARAFTYAGVPTVVMSHWQVDDESTGKLMKGFYENLAQGLPKSDALRKAKLDFLNEADLYKQNPFFWGAFVVIGDDSPIVQKSNSVLHILSVLLISIVFAGVLLIRERV